MTSPDIILEQSPYVAALERIAARDREIAELSALRATEVYDAWQLLLAEAPSDQSTAGPRWSPDRVAEVEFFTEIAMLTHRTEYRARRRDELLDELFSTSASEPPHQHSCATGNRDHQRHATVQAL